ncbi:MAG: hypothetical protein ACN4GF_01365 [Lentimonas sp.]
MVLIELSAADMQISVSEESVVLDMGLDKSGYGHYRLDASSDLSVWDSLAAIGMIDGDGTMEVFPADGG